MIGSVRVIAVLLSLSLGAVGGIVSSWDFDGSLDDTSGASNDRLTAPEGTARFVAAGDLPGVDGQAVAIGVEAGDASRLTGLISADVRLGPSYTIEAWILPTDLSSGWRRLVLNWGHTKAYHLGIHNGLVSLYHAQADGGERFAEGGQVRPNRWNHIVAVARRNAENPAQSTIEVYLNGELAAATPFDGTLRALEDEGLGVGDSASAPAPGIAYHGYIDSLTLWNAALTAAEIRERCTARQAVLELPAPEVTLLQNRLKKLQPLEAAIALEEAARRGWLSDDLAEFAARLLDSSEVFVSAMAEWAIARRVGRDNNHEDILWTSENEAAWFRKWLDIPLETRIEMDWCRQAVSLGIYDDAAALRASVDNMISRAIQAETRLRDQPGLDPGTARQALQALRDAMERTQSKADLRALWLEARRRLRPLVFTAAELGGEADAVLLYTRHALHYKPNVCGVHTSWSYKPGGDMVIVSGPVAHPKATALLQGTLGPGHVHGLDLSFDAAKVVFSWASQEEWPPRYSTHWPRPDNDCFAFELRNTTIPPHLYELDIASGVTTRLTDHNFWTDVEPVYCPDGTIAFTSDRSAHSPSCDGEMNDLTDHNLYSLSADRQRIRRLTNQKDVDMHPHLLDNGLIAYLRWEYQERDFWDVHSVWTVKPDGTMADALFKQHLGAPLSVRDARSIPGTSKLVAVAAGHHALPKGPIVILDPTKGVNDQGGIEILTVGSRPQEQSGYAWERTWDTQVVADGGVHVGGGFFMMPYALSPRAYLVSYGYGNREARRYTDMHPADVDSNGLGIYLIDTSGNMELVYRNPLTSSYGAMPFRKRTLPPVLPSSVDPEKNYATCVIPDVYEGLAGVERGAVKSLRIAEALPWPIVPGEGVKRWDLSNRWCPVRVIGTVPVEADGSAHFNVPVADNASVYFQALDEKNMEIRRMRSNISFQPGERRSCNGCHETKTVSPSQPQGTAATRPADMPREPEWGANRQLGFDWMIQPVLEAHCVRCHNAGNALDFSAGKAYQTIMNAGLVSLSPRLGDGSITQPYQYGSHKSRLITQLLRQNTPCATDLDENAWTRLVTWVDANAPNAGGMLEKRTAKGENWVWSTYPWKDIWAPPHDVPALGETIALPDTIWRRNLATRPTP